MVVTTGFDWENHYERSTEIIDLDNPSVSCTPWADSLYDVTRAVGGFIYNDLIICSGSIPLGDPVINTNKCFIVNQTHAYPNSDNLIIASESSSSVMINRESILITGGSQSKAKLTIATHEICILFFCTFR